MEKIEFVAVFGVFVLVMLSFSFVSGFGVAVSYWEPDNFLRLEPGDSADISFRLQNAGEGAVDVMLRAELVGGSEIATITDDSKDYFVEAGSEGVRTNIRVTIPEGTPLGTEYKIVVSYTQIGEDEGEMVQVAARIVQNIPVVVGKESVVLEEPEYVPERKTFSTLWITLIILAVIAIAYFLLRKKKLLK